MACARPTRLVAPNPVRVTGVCYLRPVPTALITLTGFGAKNTVRILADLTLGSGASTATSHSRNGMCIISEVRKHDLFGETMGSLQKKRRKS